MKVDSKRLIAVQQILRNGPVLAGQGLPARVIMHKRLWLWWEGCPPPFSFLRRCPPHELGQDAFSVSICVASPRHDLIGPNQDQGGLVEFQQSGLR
jgi:hypothetical protein